MKRTSAAAISGTVLFALFQVVRPSIPAGPPAAELQVPADVEQILKKSCYSCHSDERRLAWFDQPEPGYLLVRRDILKARSHLNFSSLGSSTAADQRAKLFECVNMIQFGAMPLPQYVLFHPEAKVSPQELAELKSYLSPWGTPPGMDKDSEEPNAHSEDRYRSPQSDSALALALPEPNGLRLDPSFRNWRVLSTTDRGDNNTFRLILGNDIAAKAAERGNVKPWPKGAKLAKIAWEQKSGKDGLVHPGKFLQVEIMQKDSVEFKDTDGWGWGRWRGIRLAPYGRDSRFVEECRGCHLPVRRNDSVYTQPISPARVDGPEVVNDAASHLSVDLPWQVLAWPPITMYVDRETHTTAMLFGNDIAVQSARTTNSASGQPPDYAQGSVLALVTWAQRDDPHWFGARIPDQPLTVELEQITGGREGNRYQMYRRESFARTSGLSTTDLHTADFILSLTPMSLP